MLRFNININLRILEMNKYIIIFFLMLQNLFSIGVVAGTEIKNTAYLNFLVDDIEMEVKSNVLIDLVDQKLDMKIICQENDFVMVEAGTKRAMSFYLQNYGNGEDTYLFTPLKGEVNDFEVANPSVYIDDGDGIFSMAKDKLVSELKVPADGNISLYFVSDIPLDAKDESLNGILASSQIQGDLLYGESKKVDSYYALVGTQEGANEDYCTYKVPSIILELEKKATLSSEKLFRGTIVHYEIILTAKGVGIANDISIDDIFPEGTVYVKNSLKLDGKTVGEVSDDGFSVFVGDVEQEVESTDPHHRVTFDVRVL
jgi:uncharacterized repeat protein (TIGR01451 family)